MQPLDPHLQHLHAGCRPSQPSTDSPALWMDIARLHAWTCQPGQPHAACASKPATRLHAGADGLPGLLAGDAQEAACLGAFFLLALPSGSKAGLSGPCWRRDAACLPSGSKGGLCWAGLEADALGCSANADGAACCCLHHGTCAGPGKQLAFLALKAPYDECALVGGHPFKLEP